MMKNNINWRIDENFIYLDREFQQVTWMIGITHDRDIICRFVLKNVDVDINIIVILEETWKLAPWRIISIDENFVYLDRVDIA